MARSRPRTLLKVWVAFLLGPVAWSVSLGAMFWLTNPACQRGSRAPMVVTGVVCLVLALIAGIVAWTGARRYAHDADSSEAERFLFGMAIGGSAIFALVIALSLVPVALLSPCPL
jgi:hypothetical protein